jgi:hypothetical protein
MRHLWIESELSKLIGLITTIDEYQSEILRKSMEVSDPDNVGLFDSAEHTTGLSLVACQTYMATVYGNLRIAKQRALNFGPKHDGGLTKVQIINHAANYWKHNNEWLLDRTTARKKAIERAFESIGFPVNTDYPLRGILTELTFPDCASLQSVISILETWKIELYEAAQH